MTDHKDARELFLLSLRYQEGELLDSSGNQPVLLRGCQDAWIVYRGQVDVFFVAVAGGQPAGPRHHLLRARSGQALFGMDIGSDGMGLLAVGAQGTQLLRVPRAVLCEAARNAESAPIVAEMVEGWVAACIGGMSVDAYPQDSKLLAAGDRLRLENDQAAFSKGVVWIKAEEGCAFLVGRQGLRLPDSTLAPLASPAWLRASGATVLAACDTLAFMASDPEWSGLDRFQLLMHQLVHERIAEQTAQERRRLTEQTEREGAALDGSLQRLAAVINPQQTPPRAGEHRDRLVDACRQVAKALGATIRTPMGQVSGPEDIARASRLQGRRVALARDWWRGDHGALLAYTAAEHAPVALIPVSPRRYSLHDPLTGRTTPVTRQVAATLDSEAFMFYRTLPDRSLRGSDLIRFGLRGIGRDVLMVLAMGVSVGLLSLIVPLVTGSLIDSVIPTANTSALFSVVAGLMVVALATLAFQATQAIAMTRISTRSGAMIQSAAFDRLLSLPIPFFSRYAVGDLAQRALAVESIRQTLTGAAASALLSGLFSIFSFALLFYLDTTFALVATALVLVAVIVSTLAGSRQIRRQRSLRELEGRISGLVLQTISGIAKFRAANGEARAFERWSREFAEHKRLSFRARAITDNLTVFNVTYPLVTYAVFFAVVGLASDGAFSTGVFLAFVAAFTQFLNAMLQVSQTAISTMQVVPDYQRAQPIFQAQPEADRERAEPGRLSGDIELRHVSFRYGAADKPLVLKDISLHVRPGEFVAIVGASGSGKSTLLRLLLGFEAPETGAVYYDGRDLSGVDVRAVRRQIGVVLQNSQLVVGTIFENISGGLGLTTAQAWNAARLVGLEADIVALPMQLSTFVGARGGSFSGGQRQKILIARAIARQPAVLLFDEATSALDNETQAHVMRSLEALHVTRVVIAHRLSTIVNADRIYVLSNGELVQTGTYEDLIDQPGPFFDLAERQIA